MLHSLVLSMLLFALANDIDLALDRSILRLLFCAVVGAIVCYVVLVVDVCCFIKLSILPFLRLCLCC